MFEYKKIINVMFYLFFKIIKYYRFIIKHTKFCSYFQEFTCPIGVITIWSYLLRSPLLIIEKQFVSTSHGNVRSVLTTVLILPLFSKQSTGNKKSKPKKLARVTPSKPPSTEQSKVHLSPATAPSSDKNTMAATAKVLKTVVFYGSGKTVVPPWGGLY